MPRESTKCNKNDEADLKKKTTRPFMNETYNSILGLGKKLERFARNQKQMKKRIHILEGMSQK